MKQIPQTNRTTQNLVVDIGIFLAFLVALAPRFSGIAIHEWLGIAFGAAIITHLLLHWQWIVAVTRRFFSATAWSARINYMLNALLFVAVTTIILSGLMISEEVLPLLGITASHGGIWKRLHSLAADLTIILTGIHLALHWSWLVNAVRRLIAKRTPARQSVNAVVTPKEA